MTAWWITGDTRRTMAALPAGTVDLARARIGMWFAEITLADIAAGWAA